MWMLRAIYQTVPFFPTVAVYFAEIIRMINEESERTMRKEKPKRENVVSRSTIFCGV